MSDFPPPPTWDEFMAAVLSVCPTAMLDEGIDGEIVIYTGMMEQRDGDGTVVVRWKGRP